MGYMKRDGLPEAGRRSRLLQVRIGPAEYAAIQQASVLKDMSVSEYIRCAAAELAAPTSRGEAFRRTARWRQERVWAHHSRRGPAGVGTIAVRKYNSLETVGYLKRDGRPEAGRRSRLLQVRIGAAEYTAIQRASKREDMSVSEYIRYAAIGHAHRDGVKGTEQLRVAAPVT